MGIGGILFVREGIIFLRFALNQFSLLISGYVYFVIIINTEITRSTAV